MTTMIPAAIDDASAWVGGSVGGKQAFGFDLQPSHLEELARAVDDVRRRGLVLDAVERRDFPLPTLEQGLADIKGALDHGKGLVVVRGFPVGQCSSDDIELMWWGFGLHLGNAASQSVMGDRLGHVVDVSDVDPNARAYRSQRELSLHNDFGEYHAMLSLSLPRSGGQSRYASSVAVHNIMLAEAPQHLERLYRGYRLYRLGEQGPGELPYTPHRVPVFSVRDGKLSSRYMRGFIEAAATITGDLLTDDDVAALDCFDAIAHRDEVMVEFTLEQGEAALYNNLLVMHARAAFEDDKAKGTHRHLLRLWLYTEDGRPVVPEIEVFEQPGIPPQPGQSPSGEGELLRRLGAKSFSKDALVKNRKRSSNSRQ